MVERLELEFVMHCPIRILYDRIASSSGLTEWYADDVRVSDNIFTFIWDDYEETYRLVTRKPNRYVIFENTENDAILKFELDKEELSELSILRVILDVDQEDLEDMESLIESSITKLKRVTGSN